MHFATLRPDRQRGFTMVELVMVIVLLGIIGGMVSVFMKSPIDAYFASVRRAALTDVADTTVRRMARDIQKALPNSVRTPTNQCIEFIPTKTGGRYRADNTPAGLSFDAADGSFNMMSSNAALPTDQRIADGDVIAVYNLGVAGASAYNQNNTATVTATPTESGSPVETTITIASTLTGSDMLFPLASSRNRFHVIPAGEKIVAYVCDGSGNLHRTASSNFSSGCPASGPILARNVSSCNFDYSGSDLQRNALIRMVLQFTDSAETVSLQHEVHVSNTP
jgi:MSHA biogenesis protein MshO